MRIGPIGIGLVWFLLLGVGLIGVGLIGPAFGLIGPVTA